MGFKLKKIFGSNAGGTVGMLAGGTIGAFTGNPMLGAEIGGQLGSMVGPSDERLQRRQEIQAQRDAISFWNMQNEYNSPLQQRIRLEQAGLNPYALNGSVPDNTASSVSVPSVSYRSKRKGNWSAVEKFFLNKSMENAEDQNMRNELINENWRLRNLKLAKQIEDSGRSSVSVSSKKLLPFMYISGITKKEDIVNNPNLTNSEKRFYLQLLEKEDSPMGHSVTGEATNFIYRLFRGGDIDLNKRIKDNFSSYKPKVVNGRLITGELY